MTNDELRERIVALEAENELLRNRNEKLDAYIHQGMGAYLTQEVLEEILRHREEAGISAERREVTMLFSDIRGSTELADSMSSEDYIRMLNHYLSDMIEIIDSWQGNITGFAGDGIIVVFGAPRPNDRAAFQAVGSAVAMQRRMRAINDWNSKEGYPHLQMGIGIHTGEAILGCVGSQTRMKYDMIGRNVNLAARIEAVSEGGQILVSSQTLEAAGDRVIERRDGAKWATLKGFRDKVLLHEVVGFGRYRLS